MIRGAHHNSVEKTGERNMDLKQLLSSITPDIYSRLKLGVEIGKWPDGNSLTSEQKELCMHCLLYTSDAADE